MSFPTTLWTMILRAGRNDTAQAQAALTQLCRTYWYPLYSFIRRRGFSVADAEDLVQSFLAQLLEKNRFAKVDPELGRFRSFLLASLKNFLANESDREHACKRGGGRKIISFDKGSAESRFQLEPSYDLTPERHFERQWALTLLDQVLDSLRAEYHSEGKDKLFDELKAVITGQDVAYAEIAGRLRCSDGAVKVAVHRLRHRYRETLCRQIAETVGEHDVDEELRQLLTALSA
jgi:RNA polymerase sigma-70 factor (ECF subfamily)